MEEIFFRTLRKVVEHHRGMVPSTSVLLEMVGGGTSQQSKTNTLPLRIAMKDVLKTMYKENSSDKNPQLDSIRDELMRTFNAPSDYGPLRYTQWKQAVDRLSPNWQVFFVQMVFPLLHIKEQAAGQSARSHRDTVSSHKRARTCGAGHDTGNGEAVFRIDDRNERHNYIRYFQSIHTAMPRTMNEKVERIVTTADAAELGFLDLGALRTTGMPDLSKDRRRHVALFDASAMFPPTLQRQIIQLIEKNSVHDYNLYKDPVAFAPPKNKFALMPLWSSTKLVLSDGDEAVEWTACTSETEFGLTRLHATHANLQAFAENAKAEDVLVLRSMMSGADDVYTSIYDSLLRYDPLMKDVTNTLAQDLVSVLVSRNLPTEDYSQILKETYKYSNYDKVSRKSTKNKAEKRFYRWKEPGEGVTVTGTTSQPGHTDVERALGNNLIIALGDPDNAADEQEFDIIPDSADGFRVLDQELLPIYDRAMEYYVNELHPDWLEFHQGESVNSSSSINGYRLVLYLDRWFSSR
jgi:hypothetical protein